MRNCSSCQTHPSRLAKILSAEREGYPRGMKGGTAKGGKKEKTSQLEINQIRLIHAYGNRMFTYIYISVSVFNIYICRTVPTRKSVDI